MNRGKMQFALYKREFSFDGYDLYCRERYDQETWAYAEPIVFKTQKDQLIKAPFMSISYDAAQQLMNDLWVAGVRPTKTLLDPVNSKHLGEEINWLRDVADHLMKRKKS